MAVRPSARSANRRSADEGRSWTMVPSAATWTTDGPEPCGPAGAPVLAAMGPAAVAVATHSGLAACPPPATGLFASGDGGATWRLVSTWSEFGVEALSCASAQDCWALGRGALVHTMDSGTAWAQDLPPPTPTAGVSFESAADGWGIGMPSSPGAVLVTGDGGRTWSVVGEVPHAWLDGVSAVSPTEVWVSGTAPHGQADSLWRSVDGGRTWAEATLPQPPPAAAGRRRPGLDVAAMGFAGDGRGLIWAGEACGSCGAIAAWATVDAGAGWERGGAVPPGSSGTVALAGAPGEGLAWLVTQWGGIPASLYRTSDGGAAWQQVGNFPGISDGLRTVALGALGESDAWLVLSRATGVAGRESVTLARTTDGGQDWTVAALPGAGAGGRATITFIDPSHGWLLDAGALWATSDGGSSWTELP